MNPALSVVKRLFDAGFTAYYAGGWVRDLLLGNSSTEIDIATSAPPHEIQRLFEKTIPVGAAFGVIVVVVGDIHFEVTTFRKDHPYIDGRHPDGVDFSTPEKDAWRRDFTINGMFYDPLTETIYDYVGGQEDLKRGIIRAIGDPDARFSEDRLRMIRAVRFSARFGFPIEENTKAAIRRHAPTLLPAVSIERIWQELTKMAAYPGFDEALLQMHELGLLTPLFPPIEEIRSHVTPFSYFPVPCPTIVFIMELFPALRLEEKLALCEKLKTTHADRKLVAFFHASAALFQKSGIDDYTWSHFYAHPEAPLFLATWQAKLPFEERATFGEHHRQCQAALHLYIERIRARHPLLNAGHLQKEGIKPGKLMGLLLREGEKIAINERLTHPTEILERLKATPLWPA